MPLIVVMLLIIGILIVTRVITAPATQTRAYYSFQRFWYAYWPFRRGKGLPRIARPLLKNFVPVWVQVEPHIKMFLDSDDLISRVILETGVWDEATWLAIRQHLSKGATFVDVGAHEGYCSLNGARVVGPTGRVIAIEANPEMVLTLQDNVRASGANVVAVEAVACTETERTTLDLFVAAQSNTGSSSLSKTNASLGGAVRATYKVLGRTLDAIIKEAGVSRVDVVKIDVEGSEFSVLKGAQETLAKYRPVLLVELDDSLLRAMGTSSAEITSFLGARGYRFHQSYDEANFEFFPDTTVAQSASLISAS